MYSPSQHMHSSQQHVLTFFDKSQLLHTTQPLYQTCIHELFDWLLKNDEVTKDITTQTLFAKHQTKATAKIFAKNTVTVAGVEEITYLLDTFTHLSYKTKHIDGQTIQKGQTIIELAGNLEDILTYERTILNILQRLCGIATQTQHMVSFIASLDLPKKPYIAATRKTVWSLLDKKAVAVGGGLTHRLSLADGILVKDNHLLLIHKLYGTKNEQEAVEKTLKLALQETKQTLIEIEVEQTESIAPLISFFQKQQSSHVLGILLDNFTPQQAEKALREIDAGENVVFEASGGITPETIIAWAQTGVDFMSLGALTHSVKAADISLEIV